MPEMVRYSTIETKSKREIVLLKGFPCVWGRCAFCDYIEDNSKDEKAMVEKNHEVLKNVTGKYGALEVINSGSIFELPKETLKEIKHLVKEKKVEQLYFEAYWGYRDRLKEFRQYFEIPIIFKCGIETFDTHFRNHVLKKGVVFSGPEEVAKYFQSVCIMVGILGQTKEQIDRDIEILEKYFQYGCVNIYQNNSTSIKEDEDLKKWFYEKYKCLNEHPSIDVLWNNTDFGVGGEKA